MFLYLCLMKMFSCPERQKCNERTEMTADRMEVGVSMLGGVTVVLVAVRDHWWKETESFLCHV